VKVVFVAVRVVPAALAGTAAKKPPATTAAAAARAPKRMRVELVIHVLWWCVTMPDWHP
jgi:hypothetical protein